MDKAKRVSFRVAGGISLIFFVFHLFLFRLFNWKETLTCLDQSNWAIFQTFNLVAILMVGLIAYCSFRHSNELVETSLGKSLLWAFGLFYLIRIVSQFVFFGYQGPGSLMIILLCLISAFIYLWNVFSSFPAEQIAKAA